MKRFTPVTRILVTALLLGLASAAAAAAEEKIQLAILLDTSSSMDGLIDQARSQLWKVVNELARAGRRGRHPVLEVGLFEYGNDGLSSTDGYIRKVSDLTTDLDAISEKLFALSTNGGSEYCGMVIDRAVRTLSWSPSTDVLKVIYVAGNEPFTQGELSYKVADVSAIRKGIIVNTIFCGAFDDGVASSWKDGAVRGEGRYMSIDQDATVAQIVTPYDEEILRLGAALNDTYLAYGGEGETLKERQQAQDTNAASMGAPASVERAVSKAQEAYVNSTWDLLDAVANKKIALATAPAASLPPEMRTMTTAQKEAYVKSMADKRAKLQDQINAANEKRRVFVEEQTAKAGAASTLDAAILGSVRDEAAAKGFTFP
jgi:hypothetical protein